MVQLTKEIVVAIIVIIVILVIIVITPITIDKCQMKCGKIEHPFYFDSSTNAFHRAVAINSQCQAIAVWSENAGAGWLNDGQPVIISSYDTQNGWSDAFLVSTGDGVTTSGINMYLVADINNAGQIIVCWWNETKATLWTRFFDGQAWQMATKADITTNQVNILGVVLTDDAQASLVYQDNLGSIFVQTKALISVTNVKSWQNPIVLFDATVNDAQSIAMSKSDNRRAIVFGTEMVNVADKIVLSTFDGQQWSGLVEVAVAINNLEIAGRSIDVSINNSGFMGLIFADVSNRFNSGLLLNGVMLDNTGAVISEKQLQTNTGFVDFISVSINNEGTALFGWTSESGSTFPVGSAEYRDGSWQTNLLSMRFANACDRFILRNNDANIGIAWYSPLGTSETNNCNLFYTLFDGDTWGDDLLIQMNTFISSSNTSNLYLLPFVLDCNRESSTFIHALIEYEADGTTPIEGPLKTDSCMFHAV